MAEAAEMALFRLVFFFAVVVDSRGSVIYGHSMEACLWRACMTGVHISDMENDKNAD